jgi:membrane-associated protease RseP (regulator of RpoE activity)
MSEEKPNIIDCLLRETDNGQPPRPDPVETVARRSAGRFAGWIAPFLFVLTVLTTLISGARLEGVDPLVRPLDLLKGVPFSFTLMGILFVHEMGHYLVSKHYGVRTTPPFFIPGPWFPFGIGTFGAFIRMRSPILRKRALLDIGAAGPIAGFVVALGAVIVGLKLSIVIEADSFQHGYTYGSALLFSALAHLLLQVPDGYGVGLHPVALAGWFGFFVTSLNLLPIGQLDGGHIAYALLGKRHRAVSVAMVLVLLVLGFYGWPGWYVWAFLTTVLGVRHPPIADEEISLGLRHKIVGWASFALFVLTFVPVPIDLR